MLDALIRDLRFTRRVFATRPGWTTAAILCLTIATGANTAAFTLVNGLLLRPLPFDEADRLMMVAVHEPRQGTTRPFALREYRELADQSSTTAMLLARTFFPLSLAVAESDEGPRMAQAELVSGNYFETLRVAPFLGRFFDTKADRQGATALAVLSHRVWQHRFAANPTIVGQTIRVNGHTAIVIGVAPPGFVGAMQLVAADLWLPAAMYPELAGSAQADTIPMFGVIGRLAPGATIENAGARLTIAADLGRRDDSDRPLTIVVTPAAGFGVPPAVQGTVLTISGFIYVMMGLLMIVACANVAALVLARSLGRSREIAVRLSLGASRLHIARQLLVESFMLASAGCAAGIVVALWLTQALVANLTTPFQYVSYAIDVRPDARVFAYSAIVTAVAAMLCGIAPIRFAGRVDVVDVLKQSTASGRSRRSMRSLNAVVMLQFAVSTTLLATAGILIRAYLNAQSVRPAFATAGLVAATLDTDQIRLDPPAAVRLYRTVMENLAGLPGVRDAALVNDLSLRPRRSAMVVTDPDALNPPSGARISATVIVVSPRYFQTVGLTVAEGGTFADSQPARPLVAVINQTMARRLWPGVSSVGRTFRVDPDAESIEVIGVVSNAERQAFGQNAQAMFYRPFPQQYAARMAILAKVQGDPAAFAANLRRTIRDVNSDLSIVDLRTMDQLIDDMAKQERIPATAMTTVGLLGLLLSAVGLFGVVTYAVRDRTHELGVRLALGARPLDVRRLVLRQGFTIVILGLTIGTAGTAAIAHVVRNRVFGAGSVDAATLAAVGAVLMTVGLVALYLPARSASAIDPAQTLRAE